MKKMKLLIGLSLLTMIACAQDQTFEKIIIAKKGIQFGDGTILLTAPSGTSVTWESILNKPLTFAPSVHDHNALYKPAGYVPTWSEITSKPLTFAPTAHTHTSADVTGTVDLSTAISQMQGVKLPVLSTTQIGALTPASGLLVYDVTLNVLKIYNGSIWKIIITNQ